MTTNSSFIAEVVTLTNQFRAQNGLAPLSINADLNKTAQYHSQDLALQDYFSHTGKNGSSPWDRAEMFGFGLTTMGENIAAGQTTPQSVVNGWINSPGHRANMLNPSFTQIGVGYELLSNDTGTSNYSHYWTQFFGGADGNPAAAPALGAPLIGTAAIDNLKGTAANEQLLGNEGNDTLNGLGGNDLLTGGAGNDRLIGGAGNDFLTGGDGNDQFRFTSATAFSAPTFGVDRITDFVKGSDKIVLVKTTFGNATAAQVAIVGDDSQVNASAGLIVYSTGTGKLFYNQNGAAAGLGAGGQFAKVYSGNNPSSIPVLAASDFLFA